MKRQRGRGRRSGGGNNNPNKHFESNGPDVKIRGSAQQILDKYQQYARDAQSSGDRVNAENYLQHAEHYYRVLAAMKPAEKPKQEQREGDEAKDGEGANSEGGNEAKAGGEDGQKREGGRARGRNRNRRDRDDSKPKSETTSEDAASEEVTAKAEPEAAEKPAEIEGEAAPVEEKPKRRRTYKKREAEDAPADQGDEGIMKTLSRGRKKKVEPVAEVEASVADAPMAED